MPIDISARTDAARALGIARNAACMAHNLIALRLTLRIKIGSMCVRFSHLRPAILLKQEAEAFVNSVSSSLVGSDSPFKNLSIGIIGHGQEGNNIEVIASCNRTHVFGSPNLLRKKVTVCQASADNC